MEESCQFAICKKGNELKTTTQYMKWYILQPYCDKAFPIFLLKYCERVHFVLLKLIKYFYYIIAQVSLYTCCENALNLGVCMLNPDSYLHELMICQVNRGETFLLF